MESGGATVVEEGGAADTYDLVLTAQPTAGVDVTLLPDGQLDIGGGAGEAITVAFSPADWQTPRRVTVAAVDDSLEECRHGGVIHHSVASTDERYDGAVVADVNVTIVDDDRRYCGGLLQIVPALSATVHKSE